MTTTTTIRSLLNSTRAACAAYRACTVTHEAAVALRAAYDKLDLLRRAARAVEGRAEYRAFAADVQVDLLTDYVPAAADFARYAALLPAA